MKKRLFLFFLPSFLIFISSCSSNLKTDAERIAEVICRSKGITEELTLEATKPVKDAAKIAELQSESAKIQEEMNGLYKDFNKKYTDKVKDKKFTKEFSRELSNALKTCKHLSEEDKEMLGREVEE